MLQQLFIQNFALIEQVEINFDKGLSVITGETGAGKSVLLGALGLILGNRVNHSVLKDTSRKCIIEGTFELDGYNLKTFFDQNDLDYGTQSILRREINGSGKSRSFINDTPCTLEVMKKLGSQLIDIHSQQQTLQINDPQFQLEILDALANNETLLTAYQKNFKKYQEVKKQIDQFKTELEEAKRQEDYLNFQFKELEELNLTKGENEKLEQEQHRFANSEEIIRNVNAAKSLLDEKEDNILEQLSTLKQTINQTERYDSDFGSLLERVNSSLIELQDVSNELESNAQLFEYDAERHQFVEQRLGEIHRLQQKHFCGDADDLISTKEKIENQLVAVSDADGQLEALDQQQKVLEQALDQEASKLTKRRLKEILGFEKKVEKTLIHLGIPFAKLNLDHKALDEYSKNGKDAFDFLFSANKGITPSKISKTASGGETSRLMLAIKGIMAQHQQLPTILFDEIDTGVSGEIAEKMGEILANMGTQRQVISITHLPQLAAKGQHHYFVYKDVVNERSSTQLKKLNETERISELAKMLSGATMTEAALNNAKELLQL